MLILITGATGFIGRFLVQDLLEHLVAWVRPGGEAPPPDEPSPPNGEDNA